MIKKTNTYANGLEASVVEYEDGECFDFMKQDVPLNEIVAKGINFELWDIYTEEYREYDNEANNHEWQEIEYANVTEQTSDYTILYTRLLTNDTEDGEFRLECEYYYQIMHNDSLDSIKSRYNNESKIFDAIKSVIEHYYGFSESDNCDCCNVDGNDGYKEVKLTKNFNDSQTIGEVKNIVDNASKYAKTSMELLTNGEAYKGLCFTKKGAIGSIKLIYYIQWGD